MREPKRETPVSFRPDPALAAHLAARADGGSRNLVAARDLARYYGLMAFSRRRLARMFDADDCRVIVAALGGTVIDESLIPLLGHEIMDAVVNDLSEQLPIDVPALAATLGQLTPADFYALGDAVMLHQSRARAGERPDPCDLFGARE